MSSGLYAQIEVASPGHHKFRHLGRTLGVTRMDAYGRFVALVARVTHERPDGDLSGWDAEDVAERVFWDGDPDELVRAMVAVGLLEEDDSGWRIHDWDEHTGRVLWKRTQARERKRKQRVTERDSHTGQSHASKNPVTRVTSRHVMSRHVTSRQGGAGGTVQPRPQKKPKPGWDDIMGAPYGGHPTALDFFRAEYPAYDGRNGRMSLGDKLGDLQDWHEADKKGWKTARGVHRALSRDYPQTKRDYERDQQQGLVGLPDPNKQGLSKEELDRRHAERVRRHQEQKQREASNG